jgi:outer membrane autotransporter protein
MPLLAAAAPAWADCQPDPAVTGDTVTCTAVPPDNNGFRANPGVNQLTVNVLTGVTVRNIGGIVIRIRDDSTLTNNGTLRGGDDGTGIRAGDGNTMTNAATGTIRVGDAINSDVFGVRMGDNNAFTNLGIIQVGSLVGCGCAAEIGGILARNGNAITNAGPITGGDSAFGIMVNNQNTVANSGAIALGVNGLGIGGGNRNEITNAMGGAITIGDASFGQAIGIALGNRNGVTNDGAITLGDASFGSAIGIAAGDRNRIVNNGAITLGSGEFPIGATTGIAVFDHNRITNAGSITVGDFGFGIQAGDSNRIRNDGTITVGAGALSGNPLTAAVLLGSDNRFVNNGTIRAGADAASIASCFCTSDNRVTNNGTVDGQIDLEGTNHSFTNNGLITITDAGTTLGAVHTINGAFIQNASGTLALRVTPDTTPFTYDALQADTASLGGTLKALVLPGLYQSTQTYTNVLLFCSCSLGTFDAVVASSPFFTASAAYFSDHVDLTLNRIPFGSVPGETQNQRSVGNYLEQNYSTGLTGNAALLFGNLLAAPSLGVLDQLTGEGITGTQQSAFNAGTMFSKTMLDQVLSWLDGGLPGTNDISPQSTLLQYAAAETPSRPEYKAFAAIRPEAGAFRPQRLRAWMTAFGGSQSMQGDVVIGSADLSNRTFGAAGGFDYQVGPDTLVGFAAAGTWSSFSVPGRATNGTLDAAHLGLYGVQRWGAAYLAGTLSVSHFNNSTSRTITGIGPTETALGQFASDQFGGRLQAGYKLAFDRFAVTPFAAVQYLALWQHGYSEASFTTAGAPGILGLNVQGRTISSLPTFLGAQVDTRIAFAHGVTWAPFARASWVHEFMPDRSVAAALGVLPTGTFIVDGPRASSDAARIEAGSNLYVARNVAFFGNFVGEYSSRSSSNAGNGGLRVTW